MRANVEMFLCGLLVGVSGSLVACGAAHAAVIENPHTAPRVIQDVLPPFVGRLDFNGQGQPYLWPVPGIYVDAAGNVSRAPLPTNAEGWPQGAGGTGDLTAQEHLRSIAESTGLRSVNFPYSPACENESRVCSVVVDHWVLWPDNLPAPVPPLSGTPEIPAVDPDPVRPPFSAPPPAVPAFPNAPPARVPVPASGLLLAIGAAAVAAARRYAR